MRGIGSGSFDPETLVILETAFDEAWITLKTKGGDNIRPKLAEACVYNCCSPHGCSSIYAKIQL